VSAAAAVNVTNGFRIGASLVSSSKVNGPNAAMFPQRTRWRGGGSFVPQRYPDRFGLAGGMM
jgi:hypothetical protein